VLTDVTATLRRAEIAIDALPYARTRYYGDPFDPVYSTIHDVAATARYYVASRRVGVGIGFAGQYDTTYRLSPASTLSSSGPGVRFEAVGRLPLKNARALFVDVGVVPRANGSNLVETGVVGAPAESFALRGSQVDATVEYGRPKGSPSGLTFGIKYVNQSLGFAASGIGVERNVGIFPYARLNLRLFK